ncbi:hypothetical protein I4U23_012673 [Adineta vaga]|nr:hypothetical protein I4U23_012673 [Adineta vaga]
MIYFIKILLFIILNVTLSNIHQLYAERHDSDLYTFNIRIKDGQTVEEYVQQMTNFWTDMRLNLAVPKPLLNVESLMTNDSSSNILSYRDSNKAIVVQGTVQRSSVLSKRSGYPNTVGKVYFVDGSSFHSCSASVVTSDNKDMIFTAAHCVYSTTSNAFVTNFIFIPQYENNTRLFGTWTARTLYVMQNWSLNFDINSDIAIVLLYTLNNQHIEDVVGSQAIGFNYGHSATIHSFGYPNNYFSTQMMTYCTATKYFPNFSTYTGDALSCTMNQGSSGGPWFESFSFSTLSGIQTSVNSFTLAGTPNVMYGPYFDSSVLSMYNKAKIDTIIVFSDARHCNFSVILLLSSAVFARF